MQDAPEFETMLTRHLGAAIATAYTVLRCEHAALDAAQIAAVKAACSIRSGESDASFRARLILYSHDAALHLLRSTLRRSRREQVAIKCSERDEADMPDRRAENAELIEMAFVELATLPPQTRHALLLHYIHELPLAEVAAAIGIGMEACKKRVSRGREELRRRLEIRGVVLSSMAALNVLREQHACAAKWAEGVAASARSEIVKNAISAVPRRRAFIQYGAAAAFIFGLIAGKWIISPQSSATAPAIAVPLRSAPSAPAENVRAVNGPVPADPAVAHKRVAVVASTQRDPAKPGSVKHLASSPSQGLSKEEADAAVDEAVTVQIRSAPEDCDVCGRD